MEKIVLNILLASPLVIILLWVAISEAKYARRRAKMFQENVEAIARIKKELNQMEAEIQAKRERMNHE